MDTLGKLLAAGVFITIVFIGAHYASQTAIAINAQNNNPPPTVSPETTPYLKRGGTITLSFEIFVVIAACALMLVVSVLTIIIWRPRAQHTMSSPPPAE